MPTLAALLHQENHREMSDNILGQAGLALREINQHELADLVTLLPLLVTAEDIAAVRGAILTILHPPSGS